MNTLKGLPALIIHSYVYIASRPPHLGFDVPGDVCRDLLLSSGRDEDVTLGREKVLIRRLCSGETNDSAVSQLVVLQVLGVDALLTVDNGTVFLHDAYAARPVAMQVAAGVETNVAKALRGAAV